MKYVALMGVTGIIIKVPSLSLYEATANHWFEDWVAVGFNRGYRILNKLYDVTHVIFHNGQSIVQTAFTDMSKIGD